MDPLTPLALARKLIARDPLPLAGRLWDDLDELLRRLGTPTISPATIQTVAEALADHIGVEITERTIYRWKNEAQTQGGQSVNQISLLDGDQLSIDVDTVQLVDGVGDPRRPYHARHSDPVSSHAAAEREFDAPGLRARILASIPERTFVTCDQIIEAVFGPGPYTLGEAKALNKVQTAALNLWRLGELERRDPDSARDVIRYRRVSS